MSFICQNPVCPSPKVAQKTPRVMVVVATRPVTYVNKIVDRETEEKITKVTTGSEIVLEVGICQTCANIAPRTALPEVDTGLVAIGLSMQIHAKQCRKMLGECPHCQNNVKRFNSFPLPVAAKVCLDKQAPKPNFSLARLVLGNMGDKANISDDMEKGIRRGSFQSRKDFKVMAALLGEYAGRGGTL